MLSGFAGQSVSEEDLAAFVGQAPPNDPGMIQLRLALAKWDASDDLTLMIGADGDGDRVEGCSSAESRSSRARPQ